MVKFLTDEWAREVTDAINDPNAHLVGQYATELAIQFEVGEPASGDTINYFLEIHEQGAQVRMGKLSGADLTIKTDYASASAISDGSLKIQHAFFTGKLSLSGNVAKLLKHQQTMERFADAISGLVVEY